MDGNISKEGITADMEAMKEVGLRYVTMFNTSYKVPKGNVQFMSAEWRELFHHAVREADRLGLKLGIHNCEGWSVSGGPWISPEESMQKITASRIEIVGGGKRTIRLPQPEITKESKGGGTPLSIEPHYRDIAVFALESPGDKPFIDAPSATISCSEASAKVERLVDGDKHTGVVLPNPRKGDARSITFEFPEPVTARCLEIQAMAHNQGHRGELQISTDGITYTKLTSFQMGSESGESSFSETTSRFWRVLFTGAAWRARDMKIGEIALLPDSRLPNWTEKAGYFRRPLPLGDSPEVPVAGFKLTEGVYPLDSVVDVTDKLSADGTLKWDVPPGQWTILRLGHTSTGTQNHQKTVKGPSLECDKFSRAAVTGHYNAYVGKLADDAGALAGQSFDHILIDSWEAEVQNWSEKLIEKFKEYRGYDPTPFLPVTQGYIVESQEISERFLWDFRRTMADLYADIHWGTMKKLANADGLKLYLEAYNAGNFDSYQAMSRGDVPMSEFWFNRGGGKRGFAKHAASVSHTLAKPVTAAESFTADAKGSGWWTTPFALKPYGDAALASGINRFIIHTWPHQPWPGLRPGVTFGPWGINFTGHNSWFEQAQAWTAYLTRCQFILQQGLFQADVAIFAGERAPNNGGNRENAESEGIPAGIDYDYLNAEVLAEATVKNGRITLPSGMNYRLLVFRMSTTMTPEFARKVRELVQGGALVLGPKPKRSPSLAGYPDCDAEVRRIADEVWGDVDGKQVKQHSFGKGRVYNGMSIEAILKADGLAPDMQWSKGTLDWEHRQIEGSDFYFVGNREKESIATELSLNIDGKAPEFWYPDTGKIETCGLWRVEKGRTLIPLELDPYGSLFIVFHKPGTPHVTDLKGDGATVRIADGNAQLVASKSGSFEVTTPSGTKSIKVDALPQPKTISGLWKVSFPPKLGAPESAVFNELISLTEHTDEGIKYFSGTASYTCDFEVPATMIGKDKQVMIDLGRVEVMAELFVNGKSAGILWKPPFKADITSLVKAGKHRLEVRVTNPWRNRLIGDEQKPQQMDWRKQGTKGFVLKEWPEWLLNGQPKPDDGRITFTSWRHYNKDSELHPAGLMGPVQIYSTQMLPIR